MVDTTEQAAKGSHTDADRQRAKHPLLGFRNYWYPLLLSKHVGKKLRRERLLGEDIVLFRDGGELYALGDRCPHRGTSLAKGKKQFPGSGTITCAYHGWTFEGRTGDLLACLMEGPDSTTPGKAPARAKAYPVEERAGIIWVFVGDIDPPPVEDDMPWALLSKEFTAFKSIQEWDCNWRLPIDNFCFENHGSYLHRNSPEEFTRRKIFGMIKVRRGELDDGKGLGFAIDFTGPRPVSEAEFPGVGTYPRKTWFQYRKGTGSINRELIQRMNDQYLLEVRMPGSVIVSHGLFRGDDNHYMFQIAVPIDETHTRFWAIILMGHRNFFQNLWDNIYYWGWASWGHNGKFYPLIKGFLGQDRMAAENSVYGDEYYSYSDAGVIAFTNWAAAHARRGTSEDGLHEDAVT